MNNILQTIAACLAAGFAGQASGEDDLNSLLDPISPEISKWASVCVVGGDANTPTFKWHHYQDSESAVNFWPASTIKLYVVLAALEQLNELAMPFESIVAFERREEGEWLLDSSRAMREMISEVFRHSSNTDYTLLLRMVGLDRINTHFLVSERGFPHSALMRGYVRPRPYLYAQTEPQRITVQSQDGKRKVFEHIWSGRSYSKERGAVALHASNSVLSPKSGNCTSTGELAECLRRIMFHEHLPRKDQYKLTGEQLSFIREGGKGLHGLRTATGIVAETATDIFPKAKFYHKGGWISTYSLDLACVDDRTDSSKLYIVAVATATGDTEPIKEMSRRIARWVREND